MNFLAAIAVARSNLPICAAVARATRSASPFATTWLTNPTACALVALKLRPVSSRSRTTSVSQIAFQARNSAESRNQPQPQLRKTKARHLIGDDQIAYQRQLEPSAERYAMHRRDRGERRCIDRIQDAVNPLQKVAHSFDRSRLFHLLRAEIQFAQIGARAETGFQRAIQNEGMRFVCRPTQR